MNPTAANQNLYSTAVFGPDARLARNLAERMMMADVSAEVMDSADEMLATVRKTYFRTMFVLGDLANPDCLRFLDSLRGVAPSSWLIVANNTVDDLTLGLAHRHGIDALVAMPVDTMELIRRVEALRVRPRPTF